MPKIVIAVNSAWNIYNFRLGIIKDLLSRGYEVIALAPPDRYAKKLEAIGCKFFPFCMDNEGTSLFNDGTLFVKFIMFFLKEKPDAYLSYTIKPNIYGSTAAHFLGIPVINNISGLGSVFIRKGFVMNIVCVLYKIALFKSRYVFFSKPR